MMAWAHAKAIDELAQQGPVDWVLIDQFAAPSMVNRRLKKEGWVTPVAHRKKAESDPAVAVASIIARATYLQSLQKLSQRYGQP